MALGELPSPDKREGAQAAQLGMALQTLTPISRSRWASSPTCGRGRRRGGGGEPGVRRWCARGGRHPRDRSPAGGRPPRRRCRRCLSPAKGATSCGCGAWAEPASSPSAAIDRGRARGRGVAGAGSPPPPAAAGGHARNARGGRGGAAAGRRRRGGVRRASPDESDRGRPVGAGPFHRRDPPGGGAARRPPDRRDLGDTRRLRGERDARDRGSARISISVSESDGRSDSTPARWS